MDTEDQYGYDSPSSASAATNQLWSLAQDAPNIVRFPQRILLGLMLSELGLSQAKYRDHFKDNQVRVAVLFNTSALELEDGPVCMTIYGIQSTDYDKAEDSACARAISCLQQQTNTVIKDFNYTRVKDLEEQNESLLQRLKESDECKKRLARGWYLAVRHMHSFSQQILNVVYLNHSKEETPIDKICNGLLINFQDMAFRLKHASKVLEKGLEKMRFQ